MRRSLEIRASTVLARLLSNTPSKDKISKTQKGVPSVYKLIAILPICLFLSPEQREVTAAARALAAMAGFQEPLPEGDEIAFLEKCIDHYDHDGIRGYAALMLKQERIGERLQPSEEIEIFYRASPHSVFMHWRRGQRRAEAALYVEGQNNGMMLVHPTGLAAKLAPAVAIATNGPQARDAGRYSIKEVGLRESMMRTLNDWKADKAKGMLRVKYLGIRKVIEAGDRPCYTLQRTNRPGEDNGISEVTVYVDKDTLCQIRTVIKGEDNILLGDYIFRDIRLNPDFKPNQFQRSALVQ
jgi:hypothetical protein